MPVDLLDDLNRMNRINTRYGLKQNDSKGVQGYLAETKRKRILKGDCIKALSDIIIANSIAYFRKKYKTMYCEKQPCYRCSRFAQVCEDCKKFLADKMISRLSGMDLDAMQTALKKYSRGNVVGCLNDIWLY